MNHDILATIADLVEQEDPAALIPRLAAALETHIKLAAKAVDILKTWDDIDADRALSMTRALMESAHFHQYLKDALARLQSQPIQNPPPPEALATLREREKHFHSLMRTAATGFDMRLRPLTPAIENHFAKLTPSDLPELIKSITAAIDDKKQALQCLDRLLGRATVHANPSLIRKALNIVGQDIAEARALDATLTRWRALPLTTEQSDLVTAAQLLNHTNNDHALEIQHAYKVLSRRTAPTGSSVKIGSPAFTEPPVITDTFRAIAHLITQSPPDVELATVQSLIAENRLAAKRATDLIESWTDMPANAARSILADLAAHHTRILHAHATTQAWVANETIPHALLDEARTTQTDAHDLLTTLQNAITAYTARLDATTSPSNDLPLPRSIDELRRLPASLSKAVASQRYVLARLEAHQDNPKSMSFTPATLRSGLAIHAGNCEYSTRIAKMLKAWESQSPTPSQQITIDVAKTYLIELDTALAEQLPIYNALLAASETPTVIH